MKGKITLQDHKNMKEAFEKARKAVPEYYQEGVRKRRLPQGIIDILTMEEYFRQKGFEVFRREQIHMDMSKVEKRILFFEYLIANNIDKYESQRDKPPKTGENE